VLADTIKFRQGQRSKSNAAAPARCLGGTSSGGVGLVPPWLAGAGVGSRAMRALQRLPGPMRAAVLAPMLEFFASVGRAF
jgi:hypothetical protein